MQLLKGVTQLEMEYQMLLLLEATLFLTARVLLKQSMAMLSVMAMRLQIPLVETQFQMEMLTLKQSTEMLTPTV